MSRSLQNPKLNIFIILGDLVCTDSECDLDLPDKNVKTSEDAMNRDCKYDYGKIVRL